MVSIQAQTLKSDQKSGIFRLFLILDPGNDPLKCSGIENDCLFFLQILNPVHSFGPKKNICHRIRFSVKTRSKIG